MRWKEDVRSGEERQGNSFTTPCFLLCTAPSEAVSGGHGWSVFASYCGVVHENHSRSLPGIAVAMLMAVWRWRSKEKVMVQSD